MYLQYQNLFLLPHHLCKLSCLAPWLTKKTAFQLTLIDLVSPPVIKTCPPASLGHIPSLFIKKINLSSSLHREPWQIISFLCHSLQLPFLPTWHQLTVVSSTTKLQLTTKPPLIPLCFLAASFASTSPNPPCSPRYPPQPFQLDSLVDPIDNPITPLLIDIPAPPHTPFPPCSPVKQ